MAGKIYIHTDTIGLCKTCKLASSLLYPGMRYVCSGINGTVKVLEQVSHCAHAKALTAGAMDISSSGQVAGFTLVVCFGWDVGSVFGAVLSCVRCSDETMADVMIRCFLELCHDPIGTSTGSCLQLSQDRLCKLAGGRNKMYYNMKNSALLCTCSGPPSAALELCFIAYQGEPHLYPGGSTGLRVASQTTCRPHLINSNL